MADFAVKVIPHLCYSANKLNEGKLATLV